MFYLRDGTDSEAEAERPGEVVAFARRGRGAPPVSRLEPGSTNLPHAVSTLVGREADLVEGGGLLRRSRLVTLTGPPGIGKTRLAVEIACRDTFRYADGVWFIDLGAVADASGLPDAVAAAVPGTGRVAKPRSPGALAEHIGERHMLLVVDNCEHLVAACAHLVEGLLRGCPGLDVLATSRETLGIAGGHDWTVGPLSLPDPAEATADSVGTAEAVALFVQRATERNPGFDLTDATASTVAELCRRLDGIPLAIELAAMRMGSLSPADILERLDDRFGFLTTASPTVPARHQTLLAAVESMHDLLSPAEAALLRRLSVFAGWNLAAAEEVCVGGPVERADVVDHLGALVRKSLVVVDDHDGPVRHRLLETLRVFAEAKLGGESEATTVRRAHALWCLRLAQRADQELDGRDAKAALDGLDVEHANLRAALEWARAAGELDLALRLVTALAKFWRLRGHIEEGQRWLDWALVAGAESPTPLHAEARRAAGLLRGLRGDVASAFPLLEESSALYAEAGDAEASLCACNPAFLMSRDPHDALPMLEDRAAFCRRTGDTRGLAHLLFSIGHVHCIQGRAGDARRHLDEAVQLGRGAADGEALRSGLMGLTRLDLLLGDLIAAEGWAAEARVLAENADDPVDAAEASGYLGEVARARGQWDKARRLLTESDHLARESGLPLSIACGLYWSARLAESLGDPQAGALFEQSLSVAQAGEAPIFHEIRCRVGIGSAADGDPSAASHQLLEALEMAEAVGDVLPSAEALHRLAMVTRRQGDGKEATALAHRGLDAYHRVGSLPGVASSLELLAGLAVDEHPEVATRLFAATEALRYSQGYARSRPEQARWDVDLAQLRSRLETEAFTSTWAEGAALSADEAVAYCRRGRRDPERATSGWESLTTAEREVVRLVVEGLTNPEIARRLFISPRTVGHHLRHVFDKVGIRSRGGLIKELAGRSI